MGILKGSSTSNDESLAVDEFYNSVIQEDLAIVVFYCSPEYDLDKLAVSINEKFFGVKVIGCTTAGEIGVDGIISNGISGFSLTKDEFQAFPQFIENLSEITPMSMKAMSSELDRELIKHGLDFQRNKLFAMLLIDGLSTLEEVVLSLINEEYNDIPLFGGSAGDNLNFGKTHVFFNGKFSSNSAVFVLFYTERAFKVFRTQHFTPTDIKMVVTEADQKTRTVKEINGSPAAEEFAKLVGVSGELTPSIFSSYPVVVRVGGQNYVRSIQKVNDDKSLTFYCAIEEGIVLTVAEGQDLVQNLQSSLLALSQEIGKIDLTIGCDCILRRLEILDKNIVGEINEVVKEYSIVGFSTYGEQYNAMHVNQTFTGVALAQRNEK